MQESSPDLYILLPKTTKVLPVDDLFFVTVDNRFFVTVDRCHIKTNELLTAVELFIMIIFIFDFDVPSFSKSGV